MNDEKSLLEWYENGGGEARGVVVVSKGDRESPISPHDLAVEPGESPQTDIQKEIVKREFGKQLTTQTDDVIAQDKVRIYKATGLLKVIESRLSRFAALTAPYADDAIKKEDLSSDIKKLVNELSEIVGSL